MTDFQIDVQIEAPPDLVWAIMRDVERWQDWTPTVTSIRLVDAGPLRVGTRAVVRQSKLLPAKWRVTELDEAGRNFTWVNWAPGVRVIAQHWVEASRTGSRATLSLRFSRVFAPLLARITCALNYQYLALEAKGLKQGCEASQ